MAQEKKEKKLPEPISDEFLDGYLTCMLWSSNDNSDDSGGEPLDSNYGIDDIADEGLGKAIKDCNAFVEKAGKLMRAVNKEHGKDDSQHGHDFWLTRNGHGAGFWDRGYGKAGDALTDFAKTFGECHAVIGDDGKIYLEGGR